MDTTNPDPLLLLRQSIAAGSSIVPTTSASADASAPEANLSQATHLLFTHPNRVAIPIDTPTRFVSNDKPVDLRSIYFTWLNREVAIPDYNASATRLNEELGGAGSVHKFAFVERLDLITWLEGASEESEYIKPLAGDKGDAAVAAAAVGSATTGAATSKTVTSSAQSKSGRGTLDPRYAQIYNAERKMGDRNSVLRGIKPTVCLLPITSHPKLGHMETNIRNTTGLLPHPQTSRPIPRQETHPFGGTPGSSIPRHKPKGHPPAGSHHPSLPLRLLHPSHVQHQAFPRGRPLPTPGQLGISQHAQRHAPDEGHRPLPPHAFHSGRGTRAVQARVLEPGRRRLHDGAVVAVQELQVVYGIRAVQARAGHLCRVEGRAAA